MPRIDPLQLLTCLHVLLAKNGGVLSHAEVERLAKLMGRYSKKLVSKCIYIQILKCTKTDLLGEFMRVGGWALTHTWLTDGIRGKNWPLVQEILELLLLCPVDVQRLKSNSAPKLVKQLSKDGGNEGVRIYATRLVEQWLNVVKSETKMNTNEDTNLISSIAMTSPTTTTPISSTTLVQQDMKTSDSEILNSPNRSNSSTAAQVIVKNLLSPTSSEHEQQPQRKSSTDSGIMYKIIVKDGKQILSKIENSSVKENSTTSNETPGTTEKIDFIDCGGADDNNELKPEDILSNKENDKKNNEKDIKDSKQKSKSSSSSSSNKDKHKSTSSSHKSSSKSSSSSKKSSSGTSSSSSSKSKSSSSSSHHHRNSTDSKNRDKERTDKHKSSSSKSSSSSKDKHREKSTNIKDKDKEKADQAEKDKETLSKILPPTLDKIGKIPKKIKDETSTGNNQKVNNNTTQSSSITIPSKKASMSIEIRKDTEKAKTVKTYKSQFRSHGLTEEAPPPPSRKNLKKPSSLSLPGTSIPNTTTLSLKRSSPPPQPQPSSVEPSSPQDLLPPTDKKPKIDLTSLPANAIEKPGAIKLIAPKPKPASLVESDMFMDALFASAAPKKDARKRKRRTSGSKEPSSPSDSPVTVKAAPMKFYQDTLEEKDDNNKTDGNGEGNKDKDKMNSGSGADDEDDDIPLKKVKEDIEEKCRQQEKDDNEQDNNSNDDDLEIMEQIKKPPGPGCGPNGPPGVLMFHRRRGPKKKLKWRPQEQLEEIRFFELDETERVNVTKTFTDMKQMERCNEREVFLMGRKLNTEDIMVEQTQWMPLILCDDVPTHPDGSQSKEKKIQTEREQTTLKALYFSRAMIPDSPSEPDMEHSQITEAAVIPLDDITGNPDAVNDYMKYGWPEPKGTPPPNLDDTNLGIGGRGGLNDVDLKFPNNQFNPFLPFGGNNNNNNIGQQNGPWPMGGPNMGPPPNGMPNGGPGIMPPNLMAGPMNNPFQMSGNVMPPNLMMNMNGNGGGPQMNSPSDMPNNLMPPFGPVGPNFGPPNGMMNGPVGPMVPSLIGNNNFGGPPMNMNGIPNMNMNTGPMRGMNNQNNRNNSGGNWRSGGQPINNTGNNWRGGGNQRNWVHGNTRGVCKSFMRGFCRNGNKCNYLHPAPNNNNNRI